MHIVKPWLIRGLALWLAASVAFAQQPPPAGRQDDRPQFRQEELDQMLAPIALYPDALLSQVLMAATYPLEVVQAARWSRANPGLKGEQAVRAVEARDWDPSVKSLVAFPQILTMMDERLEWTERLGDAFLGQQAAVMDSVQHLRDKAYAAGNLRSNEQMRVTRDDRTIVIASPAPQVVYVPYYNPYLVYGGWWWPAYPPVYWPAPVVYYPRPAFVSGFVWGAGVAIGAGFFYGAFNWPHRHVTNVVTVNNYYYTRNAYVNRPGYPQRPPPLPGAAPVISQWQHDPGHRRGVQYRDRAVREAVLSVDGRPVGARDGRDDRREARQQDRASNGNPGERPDARAETRDRRDPGSRAEAAAPAGRADGREVQRDSLHTGPRLEPRAATERPSPPAQPAPTDREQRSDTRGDVRVESRGASNAPAIEPGRGPGNDARDPAQGRAAADRGESRSERADRGRREVPEPVAATPTAPAPAVIRAPEARGAQPRMDNAPERQADRNPGEPRGDYGGGRGREPRAEMHRSDAPAVVVPPSAPAPRPQMAEQRAPPPSPVPAPMPQARMQAPAPPAAAPPPPRAAPAPSASAPSPQGGGNLHGGGRGGGGSPVR